jgi:hypothetical protein
VFLKFSKPKIYKMKRSLVVLSGLYLLLSISAQSKQSVNSQTNQPGDNMLFQTSTASATAIRKFAVSINPLGFMQFGPIINAEFGITESLVLNTHLRFPSAGILTWVQKSHDDGLESLSGIAIGGGVISFFGQNQHKPYVGGLLEYHTLKTLYAEGESWEWEGMDNYIVLAMNGGYRFRFEGGFFINVGGYLGAGVGATKWEYTDPAGYGGETGGTDSDVFPFLMAEATIGIEF